MASYVMYICGHSVLIRCLCSQLSASGEMMERGKVSLSRRITLYPRFFSACSNNFTQNGLTRPRIVANYNTA
jgi:hypothetical protein